MKSHAATSTHKKVIALLFDRSTIHGYMNPSNLGRSEAIDLLTPNGEHRVVPLEDVKSVYFVREFTEKFEPERKSFFSRPKLDGLWVRLKFRDNDLLEGIVSNDLLDLLVNGVQLTPPDLHGNSIRIFIPRTALVEMKVLGVVGVARRSTPKSTVPPQPKLFTE